MTQPMPEPFPQVGAVLYLDTDLPQQDIYKGNRHWKLDGSCVLVATDRILTIHHIFDKFTAESGETPANLAAFFPFLGFRIIRARPQDIELEDQTPGDNLALIRLQPTDLPVSRAEVLPVRKIRRSEAKSGRTLVCGFGSWPGSPIADADGIQQQHLVNLGKPRFPEIDGWLHPSGERRVDNLDISWSSRENGGLVAGWNNSGGAILWPSEHGKTPSVVGIVREYKEDQQASSWIGRDRYYKWLKKLERPNLTRLYRRHFQQTVLHPEQLLKIRFDRPGGASRFDVTLSTTEGLVPEMTLLQEAGRRISSKRMRTELDKSSVQGRFQHRSVKLESDTRRVVLAIRTAPRAPVRAAYVYGQLCGMFT